jgi:hypothetical protein
MKTFMAIVLLSVTFSGFAKGISAKTTLIKCAQDIVDYGIGGSEGLRFSARTLQSLDFRRIPEAVLLKECLDFSANETRIKPERDDQLSELATLRDALSPNVYFFLRGAIRPLITCVPSGLLSKCESATGKRWMETVIFDQRKTNTHYRLGHSTQGLIVRGMIKVSQEDSEYLESLPTDLSTEVPDALQENEDSRYLRIKVMKLKNNLKYIKHYFE